MQEPEKRTSFAEGILEIERIEAMACALCGQQRVFGVSHRSDVDAHAFAMQ